MRARNGGTLEDLLFQRDRKLVRNYWERGEERSGRSLFLGKNQTYTKD